MSSARCTSTSLKSTASHMTRCRVRDVLHGVLIDFTLELMLSAPQIYDLQISMTSCTSQWRPRTVSNLLPFSSTKPTAQTKLQFQPNTNFSPKYLICRFKYLKNSVETFLSLQNTLFYQLNPENPSKTPNAKNPPNSKLPTNETLAKCDPKSLKITKKWLQS